MKAFLSMAGYWDKKVREAKDRLDIFLSSKYSPRSGWPSGAPGGNRGFIDGGLERKVAAEEHLRRNVSRVEKERDEVMKVINECLDTITTPKAADAVRMIHVEGLTAPEAGKRLGVTDRHVRRLKWIGYQEMKLPEDWEARLAA